MVFVKVLDNLTAIDQNGNDITEQIPLHSRKRANVNGTARSEEHTSELQVTSRSRMPSSA